MAMTGQPYQAAADDADDLILRLADLLPDAEGELVIFADAAAPVRLLVDAAATGHGLADPHVTAGGVDVTGFEFVSFDNGITLYFTGEIAFQPVSAFG